jgi:hypothetical protein
MGRRPSLESTARQLVRWLAGGTLGLLVLVFLIWMHPARALFPSLSPSSAQSGQMAGGQGAGGTGAPASRATVPASATDCGITDFTCQVATEISTSLQQAFQPLADTILTNSADIIYQTPLLSDTTSPQNTVILSLNSFFIEVVDLASTCLLVIAAYNAIVGRHLQMPRSSLLDALPRAVLVMVAVHFNVFFVSLFLTFENTLALAIVHVVGNQMLTHIIAGMFTDLAKLGVIVFVLFVVLGIMVILLLIQMVVRLALVALSVALAPLGLGCLMLPQTMRWGRLWLVTFTSSVMVQVIQVAALGLGGIFITAIASTSLVHLGKEMALVFLAIGTMGLVLKIPGMLQTWALHPMMDTSGSGGGSGYGGGTSGSSSGSSGEASSSAGGGEMAEGAMGGSGAMEGTIVTEESGSLLLLF